MTGSSSNETSRKNLKIGSSIILISVLVLLVSSVLAAPQFLGLIATLQAGIAITLTYFKTLVQEHDRSLARWLNLSGILTIAIGSIAIVLYFALAVF